MNAAQLRISRTLWRAREVRAYREWRRLVNKGASSAVGSKRQLAHAAWEKAHKERVRRDKQIAGLRPVKISTAGLRFIIREEGERNRPYDDSEGYATTGVGHLIRKASVRTLTLAERQKWTLTDAEVMTLLAHDLDRFERAVRKAIKGVSGVTQAMFDAMVSLAFNIGEGGFATSSVAREIRAGNFRAAASAFMMWDRPAVLEPRREREVHLFLTSNYTTT